MDGAFAVAVFNTARIRLTVSWMNGLATSDG
jgi:hypothetical protein